ncbi:unnamed protein product [marine sediment metagenome]|uniref:Uncharacterized protein n=1 Tax=marine sediment metagenome TaxID=412755 RepID=X1QTL8_9ZZZZ
MDKQLMKELGLIPEEEDLLGGETTPPEPETSSDLDREIPHSPPLPADPRVKLAKDERANAQEQLAPGIPMFHYGRLDQTTTGNYVITITDITGTLSIQMLWTQEFLDAFMLQAAKQKAMEDA